MPGIIPYKAAKQQYPQKVTAKLRAAFSLGDQPTEQLGGWLGYFHFQDPTTLPKDNVLTYPSINCFIPFKDKVVPRSGTTLLGSPFTQPWGSVGHLKKYGTMSGIETEIRVNKSTDDNLKDILSIWIPTSINGVPQSTYQWLQITLNTNPLPAGAHEYYFDQWFDTDLDPAQSLNLSRAIWVNGTTNIFSWTGGIAPITIVSASTITTVPGVTWASQGFVDPAFDSTLNGTITINGLAYTVTGGWETDTLTLTSTAGISINDVAISQIQQNQTPVDITGTITHGVVTQTPVGGMPFQKGEEVIGSTSGATGFITIDELGPGPMLLYGIKPGPSTFFTVGETITGITSKSTTVVTTYTQTNTNQLVFDVCGNNLGYMYYGCWNSMKVYQSNQFNKDATEYITNVQAVQNDLVLGTTPYTGTGQNVYRVTIDSVNPNINTQIFYPANGDTLNDGVYDTSLYSLTDGITHKYKVTIVSDTALATVTGSAGDFAIGDTIIGSTSLAQAIVVHATLAGNWILDVAMQTINAFEAGETITDTNNGHTQVLAATNSVASVNGYTLSKDGLRTPANNFARLPTGLTPITLVDGLKITFGNYFGHSSGDVFELDINYGGNDTYKWQINGATPVQTNVPIPPSLLTITHGAVVGSFTPGERVIGSTSNSTGYVVSDVGTTMIVKNVIGIFTVGETITGLLSGATTVIASFTITGVTQILNDGISISFISNIGHTIGDFWDITATQSVGGNTPTVQNQQAFANFYYTLPARIPGEGYIYQLKANFWAMAPQESQMYICDNYGQWSYITVGGLSTAGGTGIRVTSVTATTEPISITPLKQVSASKPIFPYMIGYLDNDLIFVTTDKTLDLIGRMQLIQLPRIDNMSQPVQLDFDSVSFKGGSMEYWHKQLWINSPIEGVMFCYDNHPENKYWQPPQMIPENGLLSVVNMTGTDILISHSPLFNQSWQLFTGTNGDNGTEYLVQARTPYLSKGDRWGSKSANMTFSEGYVTGAPPMVQTLYKEVNGCGGIVAHDIVPVTCISQSNAPFGMGHFGSHPNGSDLFNNNNYFREIYPYQQTQNYYFAAIQMSCTTTNHSYEWLTFGINSIIGSRGNIDFKNQQPISRN